MKEFILGALTVLTISWASHLTYMNTDGQNPRLHKFTSKLDDVLNGQYIGNPINGNCRDEMSQNGFGWKFNVADYYGCDWFQRALNGNFKKPNKNTSSFK